MAEIDMSKITAAQLEKLEKIRKKIAQLEAREQTILARRTRQQRADETRRSIVLGKRLQGLMPHDKRARTLFDVLLVDLESQFQYLFPERFPDAKRPSKKSTTKDETNSN